MSEQDTLDDWFRLHLGIPDPIPEPDGLSAELSKAAREEEPGMDVISPGEARYEQRQCHAATDEGPGWACALASGHAGPHVAFDATGHVMCRWKTDPVCEHGTAMDVHCCNCHGGFLFDSRSCVCKTTSSSRVARTEDVW